jgi:hypothetical protein
VKLGSKLQDSHGVRFSCQVTHEVRDDIACIVLRAEDKRRIATP